MRAQRITELSDEQWRRVDEERERWVSIGASTEPADRATTEEVITDFYRRTGNAAPVFVWLDGPASCCLAGGLLRAIADPQLRDQLLGHLRDQLGDQLRSQLGDQLWSQLRGQLGSHLWDQLGDQLEDQLWSQLRDQLGDQLRGQLWSHLRGHLRGQLVDQLRGQLRDQLQDHLWDQLQGQLGSQARAVLGLGWWAAQPAYWVGWYATCRDVVGVRYASETDSLLRQWERLAAAGGWWFPTAAICFCAERDQRIRFDQRRLLHCEDGPAILCRDGYAVYAWHGIRVPAEWIESRDTIDPSLALTHPNLEERRCLAEIIGWSRVIAQLSPTVVDEATPDIGTLLRVDLPDAPGEQFLRVRCGTGRDFVLPVPPGVRTAQAAQDWMWGLGPGEYQPEIRT